MPTTTDTPPPTTTKGRSRKKLRLVEPAYKKVTRQTPGSLAHAFFLQKLDNTTVYSFLQHIQEEDPRVENLLADYDQQTDSEKGNAAIWDKLAHKHKIPIGKLYGKLAEAMLLHGRSLGYSQLAADTPEVLASLGKAAKKQKNLEHMRLHLETSGMVGKNSAAAASININLQQNNDNRQVNFGLPQLDQTLKDSSRKIREEGEKLLTEGTTEFIDVEVIKSKEEQPCTIPRS